MNLLTSPSSSEWRVVAPVNSTAACASELDAFIAPLISSLQVVSKPGLAPDEGKLFRKFLKQ